MANATWVYLKATNSWGVRAAPSAQAGDTVVVIRKDGSSSTVVLEQLVMRYPDASLWVPGVQSKTPSNVAVLPRRGRCTCDDSCCAGGRCRCASHCNCKGGNIYDC